MIRPRWQRFQVLVAPFLGFVPFYIGAAEGYYAEQNLEVELVPIESPNAVLPARSSKERVTCGRAAWERTSSMP